MLGCDTFKRPEIIVHPLESVTVHVYLAAIAVKTVSL